MQDQKRATSIIRGLEITQYDKKWKEISITLRKDDEGEFSSTPQTPKIVSYRRK